MEKPEDHHIEDTLSQSKPEHDLETHVGFNQDATAHLSAQHKEYLIQRHGSLELDPIPDMNDADPYNWPTWKVRSSSNGLEPQLTKYRNQ